MVKQASKVLREEGINSLWFKLLSEIGCYRRLLLLQRSLDESIPEIKLRLPVTIKLLKRTELDEYLIFRPKVNPSCIMDRFRVGHWCFVARYDERIISASWAATHRAWSFYLACEIPLMPDEVYVYDSFTKPEFRGQAIFPAMRAKTMLHFHAAGYRRMIGGVAPENKPMLRAVHKIGFRSFRMMAYIKIGAWRRDFYRIT
jgi:hypothetical protein